MISLEQFRQIDLRIGEIVVAEPIAGSDRLRALTVDLGKDKRTVVAGVAGSYAAAELEGMQVVFVANLEPARIRGVESQGMILGVGCDDASGVALLTVNRRVPNGSPVE